MIEFLDPRGQRDRPIDNYELEINLHSYDRPTVGFLANGFPDSEKFLEILSGAMLKEVPDLGVHHFNKRNASISAPDSMIDEIVSSSSAVVTAYGH
tara:strand:+ start:528 stop:815 length:288 start_codon:yes stop_codon:yes gene_type:complete